MGNLLLNKRGGESKTVGGQSKDRDTKTDGFMEYIYLNMS